MTSAAAKEHLPLVRAIARNVQSRYCHAGPGADLDDLVSFGSKGLIEAAERFDPTRDVAFSTFAYRRIHGAMVDGIRQMGAFSRSDVERFRKDPEGSFSFVGFDDAMPANDVSESPEDQLDRARILQVVRRTLDRLPARSRDIIRSYFFAELTLDEIGDALGVTKSWVSRLLDRAIRELRAKARVNLPELDSVIHAERRAS